MIKTKQYDANDFSSNGGIRAIDLEIGDVVLLSSQKLFWIENIDYEDIIDETKMAEIDESHAEEDDYSDHPVDPEKTLVSIYEEFWNKDHRLEALIIENIPGTALIEAYKLSQRRSTESNTNRPSLLSSKIG